MSANKAFYTLLATFTFSLVGLTVLLTKSLPLIISHAIYVCQKNLSNIVFLLPHGVPFALAIVAITVLSIGVLTLVLQIIQTRLYIRRNTSKRLKVTGVIRKLSFKLGLDGRIDIVQDNNRFSFCYGLVSPRIALSTGLIKSLTLNELKGVLLHESYHLKNYDPLKIIMSKVASGMFFFIPTFKDIQKYYAFSKEIAADQAAIKFNGKNSLLSALSKIINIDTPKFSGVAALATVDDLEKRIKYLTGQPEKAFFRPSLVNIVSSFIVVLFSFVLLNAPVHAITMDGESMGNDYFLCPFGEQCARECKNGLKTKEINFSENRLYTPKDSPK